MFIPTSTFHTTPSQVWISWVEFFNICSYYWLYQWFGA